MPRRAVTASRQASSSATGSRLLGWGTLNSGRAAAPGQRSTATPALAPKATTACKPGWTPSNSRLRQRVCSGFWITRIPDCQWLGKRA